MAAHAQGSRRDAAPPARPLDGVRILEFAGTGPAPFAGMVLSDLGADVLRISRRDTRRGVVGGNDPRTDLISRGRRSLAVDLKDPRSIDLVLDLVEEADALVEPFRPGVMERLGLGPDVCMARNRRLVYARMTGWGQEGPYASKAGHDINYIALNGVLSLLGRADQVPTPPFNLIGDFAGGAMFLVTGVLAALMHAGRTGEGQVLDVAMVDGSALLAMVVHNFRARGGGWGPRGTNMLDTGAPFYDVYETADGRYMSVGSIEQHFYRELLAGLGLSAEADHLLSVQHDRSTWAATKARFAAIFASRTRDEWEAVFAERDACVCPVLDMDEAVENEHMRHRGTYAEYFRFVQPSPAPRFSSTPASVTMPPPRPNEHAQSALAAWGFEPDRIADLTKSGVIALEE